MLGVKYHEDSPSGLIWSLTRGNQRAGNVAGNKQSNGYWRVGRNNRTLAHRIVWEIFNGPIPDGWVVDHLDGNRSNNRITNLRCIEYACNSQNRKMMDNNVSGTQGVHWDDLKTAWVASWYDNGRRKCKTFSLKKHGEKALTLAVDCRNVAVNKLNSLGSMYTERHTQSV